MRTGVDALHLFAPHGAFKVAHLAPEKGWTITALQSPKAPKPGPLLMDGTGSDVVGSRAFLNTTAPGSPRFDIDARGLRVAFNPCKAFHPFELSPIDALPDTWAQVEATALMHGLELEPGALRLARVDLAAQALMDEPLHVYASAYPMLSGPRMKVTAAYPGGFRVGNKQTQTVFYSKRDELIAKQKKGYGCPERLLRTEVKFLRHGPATKALQATYLPDLFRLPAQAFDEAYKDYLNSNVFKPGKGVQTHIPFSELRGLWAECGAHLPRYRAVFGVEALLNAHGGFDGYLSTLQAFGVSKRTLFRERNEVRAMLARWARLRSQPSDTGALFAELQIKFAA